MPASASPARSTWKDSCQAGLALPASAMSNGRPPQAGLGQRGAQAEDLRHGRGLAVCVGEDTVAAGRPADHPRVAGGTGHPDRDGIARRAALLQADLVVLAVVPAWLAGPDRPDQGQPLVVQLPPDAPVGRLAEPAEIAGLVRAEAGAEDEPPAGERADRGRLPGDHPGTAPGQRGHHRPQPERPGGLGHGRQAGPGVGDRHVRPYQVVPQEHPVPAACLGPHRQVGQHRRIAERPERRQVDPEPDRTRWRHRARLDARPRWPPALAGEGSGRGHPVRPWSARFSSAP